MARPVQWLRDLFSSTSKAAPSATHQRRLRQPGHVRHPYAGQRVLSGISPKRLARVLRAADEGSPDEFLLAAQELEERDAQYGAQMAVRRAAVSALELAVHEPAGAGARATKAAQQLVDSGRLRPAIHFALDAIGKGFSISEIVWVRRQGLWWPTFLEHDPREFSYDADERLWRLDDGTHRGAELAPRKWVIHEPRGRSGLPIRRGTARPAMFLHMAKSMSLAGWVTLMQVFGLPLAIARAPKDLTANDRATLTAALAGLGQGVNAIVPEGASVEIVKAADAGATPEKMYELLLKYVDGQLSKLVLGQTMTADDGSSQAQAKVHNEVRKDIREGDAEQLAATLNEYISKPFIDFNVGEQRVYPELVFPVEDERDLKVWGQVVVDLESGGEADERTEARERR